MKLKKFTPLDKKEYPDAFHVTMKLVGLFSERTFNCPHAISGLINRMHLQLNDVLCGIFRCANTMDFEVKAKELTECLNTLYLF